MTVFAVLETEYGTSHWCLYGLFETRKAACDYAAVLRADEESVGGFGCYCDPVVQEWPVQKMLDHPLNPGHSWPEPVQDIG